jgi:TPR repeat protein
MQAQEMYAITLLSEPKDQQNLTLGVNYFQRAAGHGLISAQLLLASLLWQGQMIKQNRPRSAQYFKLAANQGSIEGQLEYALCLLRGDGVSIAHQECQHCLRQAVEQSDVGAQMRLGICLLCDRFDRFEFEQARELFDLASVSNRFGQILGDSLCQSDCELITPSEFSSNGSAVAHSRFLIHERYSIM